MNWSKLLVNRRVQPHRASEREIANLHKLVKRDLTDARVTDLSPDRRFATAYNAILQLSKIAIACAGYRVSLSMPGHNQTTLEAVGQTLGPGSAKLTDYFETCRLQRDAIDYASTGAATDAQARELLEEAEEYRVMVEAWIVKNHPRYSA